MPRITTTEDATKYWDGTIVEYKKNPYYCSVDNGLFYLKTFEKGRILDKVERLKISHDPFELSHPNVGYVNLTSGPIYLQKAAYRQWKFGLCAANVSYLKDGSFEVKGLTTANLIKEEFKNTYLGIYPSLPEAVKSNNTAFSREYAVVKNKLFHKNIHVGFLNGNLVCSLYPDYYNTLTVLDLQSLGCVKVIEIER